MEKKHEMMSLEDSEQLKGRMKFFEQELLKHHHIDPNLYVEYDVKKGNYNPFAKDYIIKGFDDRIKNMLLLMMAETCREFEKLPIIKYADILRNILYSGVWCRFESISRKRREEREKEDV